MEKNLNKRCNQVEFILLLYVLNYSSFFIAYKSEKENHSFHDHCTIYEKYGICCELQTNILKLKKNIWLYKKILKNEVFL